MTIILTCRVPEGAIMLADSRAVWQRATTPTKPSVSQDTLQKILPLGPRSAIGYAGGVGAAGLIINEIRKRLRAKPRLRTVRKLAADIPRVAKYYYGVYVSRTGHKPSVALMLGGVTDSGAVLTWWFASPTFVGHELASGYKVLGSGDVVESRLAVVYPTLAGLPGLKDRTDSLLWELMDELSRIGVPTVGGLPQVVALTQSGIQPLRYGFMTVDPRGSASPARTMEMVSGRWIQTDLTSGDQIAVTEPAALLSGPPVPRRVHDYAPAVSAPILKWNLTRFLTCLTVDRDAGSTEFNGVFTALASSEYPARVTFMVSARFWGPVGQREATFVLVRGDERQSLLSETVNVLYATEDVQLERVLTASIQGPGPAFLEFSIDGHTLGRRPLYFGEMPHEFTQEAPSQNPATLNRALLEQQRACVDAVIEESRESKVVYWTICHNCIADGTRLRFEGELMVVYWRSYPLRFPAMLAGAFFMPAGAHTIRVDLVNAASRQVTPITTAHVTSSSSYVFTTIHGQCEIVIPSHGLYFLNLYVDDVLTTPIVLVAETDQPAISYGLHDADLERVRRGEFAVLLRGAKQTDVPGNSQIVPLR